MRTNALMVALAEVLAIVLYALPLGLLLVARSREGRELWQYALDLPLFVATDLLVVMVVARAVRLDLSILIVHGVWTVGGVTAVIRGRTSGAMAWPSALRARGVRTVLVTVLAAVALSAVLSRSCHNADRAWHIPLTSLIRSQHIPFPNVYAPGGRLAYHYAGDVFGATFQVLSLDTIHASRALSIAHDVAFGLTGASIALLLLWLGYKSVVPITGMALATLLAGPQAVLRDDKSHFESGFSFINFLKLSFRPPACLAGLFMVGFIGAVFVRLRSSRREPAVPLPATLVPLLAATAALALTDEATIGVLGISLGLTWLAFKDTVNPKRLGGVGVFLALAAAVAVPLLAIGGSVDPNQKGHAVAIVPWHWPAYAPGMPAAPLPELRAWKLLFFDLAPMLFTILAGLAVVARRGTRDRAGALALYAAIVGVAVLAITRLEVDKLSDEGHRFMTPVMFLFPLTLGFLLAPSPEGASGWFPSSAFAPVMAIFAMGLSSVSTLDWLTTYAPNRCTQPSRYSSKYDFFAQDCHDQSAGFGEEARPTYLAADVWYYHAGCHPIFSSGPDASHWTTKIGLARFGVGAFREIDRDMLKPDESMPLVCKHGGEAHDPVCAFAAERGHCHPLGPETDACELSGPERAELEGKLPRGPAPKPAPASREGVEPVDPPQDANPH